MSFSDWAEIRHMDELARMDTPLHRLDARAKGIVTVVFILAVVSFPRHTIAALTPFLFYPVALIALGRIPVRGILKKMLVAAPFALAVGIFNPIMDRQPVLALGPFMLTGGWISFISVLFRFVLTVGAALALVVCTGMHRLGAGMEQIGVPRVFVVQVMFLYRYLFTVSDEGARMMRGIECRSSRPLRLRAYGSLLGSLLLRAMDRADRVYRAMTARGFDGVIRTGIHPSLRGSDWIFICGGLIFIFAARRWDMAACVGRILAGAAS